MCGSVMITRKRHSRNLQRASRRPPKSTRMAAERCVCTSSRNAVERTDNIHERLFRGPQSARVLYELYLIPENGSGPRRRTAIMGRYGNCGVRWHYRHLNADRIIFGRLIPADVTHTCGMNRIPVVSSVISSCGYDREAGEERSRALSTVFAGLPELGRAIERWVNRQREFPEIKTASNSFRSKSAPSWRRGCTVGMTTNGMSR